MQNSTSKHIQFISGLKGSLAVLIVILHYLVAFFPYGYTNWGSGLSPEEQYMVYFRYYPLSLFFRLSLLPLFYALIAYIPAIKLFRDSDTKFIERQALGRYLRLMPLVLVTAIFSYAFFYFGFSRYQQIYDLIGNHWVIATDGCSGRSWLGAIKNGVWDTFIEMNGKYCSVLWCINDIFVGSYLTYSFLMIFHGVKHRLPVYLVSYLILLRYPAYCGFLSGIAAADIYVNVRAEQLKKYVLPSVVLAFLLVLFPEPMAPAWFKNAYREGIASFLILFAMPFLPRLNKCFSADVLDWFGNRSFSLILTHFPIMLSVSAWVFEKMYSADVPQFFCMLTALLAGLPMILIATEIMYRCVEIPSGKFTKWIVGKLSPTD